MSHVMTAAASYRFNRPTLDLLAALLLGVVLAPPALAQPTGESFAEGDILKITAYGREDLTGQYSVQPGPVLSLPLVGAVKLENRSPRQLETELATAWENRLGTPMSVTIEFAQRAPVYIIGAVNSPGAYPYRHGMTVLQAVAVSGGMQRSLSLNDSIRLDVIRERERRLQAIEKLAGAVARRARLIAERDGKPQITLEEPFTLFPKQRMDALLAQESTLLDTRTKQYAIKERLLADQIRLGEAEIASYQQQYKEMEAQQAQIGKEAARIRRVPGQQVRVFELEQRSTTLETTKASITASISRTAVEVETARNGMAEAREARQREITEALLEAERTISETTLTEAAARDVLNAAGYQLPDRIVTFKLMQQGQDELAPVKSSATLRPGDLLEVTVSDSEAFQQSLSQR